MLWSSSYIIYSVRSFYFYGKEIVFYNVKVIKTLYYIDDGMFRTTSHTNNRQFSQVRYNGNNFKLKLNLFDLILNWWLENVLIFGWEFIWPRMLLLLIYFPFNYHSSIELDFVFGIQNERCFNKIHGRLFYICFSCYKIFGWPVPIAFEATSYCALIWIEEKAVIKK